MRDLVYVIPERQLWDLIKAIRHYRIFYISASDKIYLLGYADQCPNEDLTVLYGLLSFLKAFAVTEGYFVFNYKIGEMKYLGQTPEAVIINIVSGEINESIVPENQRLSDWL